MISTRMSDDTLEDLATETIRLGREFQRVANDVWLGGNSRAYGFVDRTFQRLADRDPFDCRDDASLEGVRRIIESDLRSEVQGTERRFIETYYDATGQHGELRDCPVYSARGKALLAAQRTYEKFIASRARTLDRVAAEKALLRLLAP